MQCVCIMGYFSLLHMSVWFLSLFAAAKIHVLDGRQLLIEPSELPMQFPVKAYVVSKDEERWLSAKAMLEQCGFQALRVNPVTPDEARAEMSKWNKELPPSPAIRLMSLTMTYEKLGVHISMDEELDPVHGYSLIFEDDAALNEGVSPDRVSRVVHAGAAAARQQGYFSMGMCLPYCSSLERVSYDGVQYSRCLGYCTHAWGLFRHSARDFWIQARDRTLAECSVRKDCSWMHLVGPDVRLFNSFKAGEIASYPVLIGSNLSNHEQGGMTKDTGTGLFYQANSRFPAKMWTEAVEGAAQGEYDFSYRDPAQ